MESYIIRLLPGAERAPLRGVLRRVADGNETTFADGEELLRMLRESRPDEDAEQR